MESTDVSGPAKNIIHFAQNARTWQQAGIGPVQLALLTYTRCGDSAFVRAARDSGLAVFTIPEAGAFDTSVIRKVKRVVREFTPDILQSHNIKSHCLVRLNGLYKHVPWIAFNHGYTAIDLKDRLLTHMDRWSLRRAYRVVAVCGPFAQRLASRGVNPSCIRVQHNSVRPFVEPGAEETASVRREVSITDEHIILCVGRLSTEKAQEDLLLSIDELRRAPGVPAFRAVIVGDGPERERLESLTRSLDISDRCVFAGHRTNILPWYRAASLLVLPSHSEGSPNVVLEAMSAGLPVLATTVGGVPEIIRDGVNGILIRPRDPAAMARQLACLLKDGVLRDRLGTAAREHVNQYFTPEAYTASMCGFYQQVLEEWHASRRSQ